jgi:hypothetical protein
VPQVTPDMVSISAKLSKEVVLTMIQLGKDTLCEENLYTFWLWLTSPVCSINFAGKSD